MAERTYKNTGDCIKCIGSVLAPRVKFKGPLIGVHGGDSEMIGELWAECQLCGFKWVVRSKDEPRG